MSFLPEIANPYFEALAGGFLYGSIFCTSACLPFIASYIAGIGAGFRKGVAVTLFFNSGRIVAYALMGAAIGIFKLVVSDAYLTPFQQYSSLAFGIVSIVVGLTILFKTKRPACKCKIEDTKKLNPKKIRVRFDVGAFTLGLSRGFVICTPLLFLLLYAATFASPIDVVAIAVLFGLGTAISPILLLGGATGWLLNKAPLLRKWISISGAGILMAMGTFTLIEALTLKSP